MNIKEEITISLSKTDIHDILFDFLKSKGYETKNIWFNIEEKCEGYPEVYYKVFTGATCKVERLG